MGCDTCHVTHKTGEEPTAENRFHLTKPTPALCVDCHDIKDADLQKAHQNQPFGTSNCLECHDPHQSDAPKLMAKFVHAPFQGNGCDTCHAPAKDGKVVLTQPDVKSSVCHVPRRQGQADRFGQGAPSWGGRRLHRLPQPARQQPARIAQDRRGEYLPWMPQRHRAICARNPSIINPHSNWAALPATRLTAEKTIICCAPRATLFAWSAMVRTQYHSGTMQITF